MVAQMVTPSCTSDFTTVMVSLEVYESRPDVGSSRNSTRGLTTIASATLVRFAWPPEIPLQNCEQIISDKQTCPCGEIERYYKEHNIRTKMVPQTESMH